MPALSLWLSSSSRRSPGETLCTSHLESEGQGESGQINTFRAPWRGDCTKGTDSLRGLLWQFAPPGLSTALHRTRCSRMGFWKELWGGQGRRDKVPAWSVCAPVATRSRQGPKPYHHPCRAAKELEVWRITRHPSSMRGSGFCL